MAGTKDWRQFEELVSRIERAASAHGALVTSPDRIRDLTTGQLREVDASIRQKIGTSEILVTIECRKRGRTQDDTWIEQLATKRQKIGAAKTIAVSAAGFTTSAIESAKHFGIELRTLAEVAACSMDSWLLPTGAVHVCRLIENIRCGIVLYDDSGQPLTDGFWAPDVELPVCYHADMKSPFAVQDYLPLLEATHPEMFDGVPLDGTKVELEFPIEWSFGELSVAMTTGRKWVYLTKLVADVSYQATVCDLHEGTHHEYRSAAGDTIQHTSFDTTFLGMPVTFEHQSDPRKGQVVRRKFRPPSSDEG
ncbi:restriction endonuclease [Bradyrhizobium barranii]